MDIKWIVRGLFVTVRVLAYSLVIFAETSLSFAFILLLHSLCINALFHEMNVCNLFSSYRQGIIFKIIGSSVGSRVSQLNFKFKITL